jgi:hypothetical protein
MELIMLFGIPELTYDGTGYIYWKGQEVDHYNCPTDPEMKPNAIRLAERCRYLESIDVPVRTGTAIWKWNWFDAIPADHPYKNFFFNLCSIYQHPETKAIMIVPSYGRVGYLFDGEWKKYKRFEINDDNMWNEDIFDYHPCHKEGYRTPDMGQGTQSPCYNGETNFRSISCIGWQQLTIWLETNNIPTDLFTRKFDEVLDAPVVTKR